MTLSQLLGKQKGLLNTLHRISCFVVIWIATGQGWYAQIARFHFVNVLSRWQKIMSGTWGPSQGCECALCMVDGGIVVEVITITIRILRLRDWIGKYFQIYLNIGNKSSSDPYRFSPTRWFLIEHPNLVLFSSASTVHTVDRATFINKLAMFVFCGFMAACSVEQLANNVPHLPIKVASGTNQVVGQNEKIKMMNNIRKSQSEYLLPFQQYYIFSNIDFSVSNILNIFFFSFYLIFFSNNF